MDVKIENGKADLCKASSIDVNIRLFGIDVYDQFKKCIIRKLQCVLNFVTA